MATAKVNLITTPGRLPIESPRAEQEREAKMARVQTAIDEGDASGIAEPGTFDRVRRHLQIRSMKE